VLPKHTSERTVRRALRRFSAKSFADAQMIEQASSARDLTASTRNQKSPQRTLRRFSEKAKSFDDAQMLPKQLVSPDTKVRSQGLNAKQNPALNGQTVTIAKFLQDEHLNRSKPNSVEAADATSTQVISSLPVHKRIVPAADHHVTRRPLSLSPQKTSSHLAVLQKNRKSGPLRSGKRPAYQTSKSECFVGVKFPLEDEFPSFPRYVSPTKASDGLKSNQVSSSPPNLFASTLTSLND
jgi:hypothetical protein